MSENVIKPLNWVPTPGIGYTVVRRSDGGMHFTFIDSNPATLKHWRDFSLQHLYDSDRLTRNLYDLRAIQSIPAEAVRIALEVNSDPSVRNIRLAVVVANEAVRAAINQIASVPGGVEAKVFTSIDEAEIWLNQPLTNVL